MPRRPACLAAGNSFPVGSASVTTASAQVPLQRFLLTEGLFLDIKKIVNEVMLLPSAPQGFAKGYLPSHFHPTVSAPAPAPPSRAGETAWAEAIPWGHTPFRPGSRELQRARPQGRRPSLELGFPRGPRPLRAVSSSLSDSACLEPDYFEENN